MRSPLSEGFMVLLNESETISLRVPLLQPLAKGLRLARDVHLLERLSMVSGEEGI